MTVVFIDKDIVYGAMLEVCPAIWTRRESAYFFVSLLVDMTGAQS